MEQCPSDWELIEQRGIEVASKYHSMVFIGTFYKFTVCTPIEVSINRIYGNFDVLDNWLPGVHQKDKVPKYGIWLDFWSSAKICYDSLHDS